ncbi:hypothetical protein CLAFUW4_12352 [Fulvia fulva]|uniref:Uncharacterized protein n=1 Tax=Passalora fulva TaxID=5499 RepID=A0A9Q8PEI0_PASFU|nr:uncharacterized protein CLAFUR5_11381 [Fulvia fulva]KAK4618273.1 hypothetical protein CLAFUR4_12357 [Fulvia fulva]KAK4619273.1 hypothetical protein CLAFUR0_12368 [Fulvia fulva]UJO20956.1 hypothetical protein CLAFUR5_11381 [Fulvia fulva]WPV18381.1 hypothetical protein CLAFUW4_12352 [Fulvia fulva]WPV33143.1 hypothetical protein CLAFUW7_12359 [Fulvia fulva]
MSANTISTIYRTPESAAASPDLLSGTPTAPGRNRATSEDGYFNITWSEELKGLPSAISMSRSNITEQEIILSSPPAGLLFKRRLWNRETDHGRLCDPDGWQGSLENEERFEEQRQINEEWLEDRDLLPLDPSVFKKVDWKKHATLFEVPVSPKTILIEGGIVECPWVQAAEAHGSLNNSRRHHARLQANLQWMSERGESPLSVDTFTAINWYTGSSKEDPHSMSSPRGTEYVFPEADTVRYDSFIGNTRYQYAYSSPSPTTDSLISFADLISKYNYAFGSGDKSPGSSIGRTQFPYPSPSSIGRTQYPYPSPTSPPSLTNDTSSDSSSYDDEEPILQTAAIALVISPRSSKASMLSAGNVSQARRSPRGSATFGMPMQEGEGPVELRVTQDELRGPPSPVVRLIVIGGKAVRQGDEDDSGPGWASDSLLRTPTVAGHRPCGIWKKTKGVFGRLDCRGRK